MSCSTCSDFDHFIEVAEKLTGPDVEELVEFLRDLAQAHVDDAAEASLADD